MRKEIYLVLAVLGFVVPYVFFIAFLLQSGLDLELFIRQMFENHIAAFFAVDVLISTIGLLAFVFNEGPKLGMKNLWVYLVCNLFVGVSLALPLFLYFRERKLEDSQSNYF